MTFLSFRNKRLKTPIALTYEDLAALKSSSSLTPGQTYIITDFKTLHLIPNTTDRNDIHNTVTPSVCTINANSTSYAGTETDVKIFENGVEIASLASVDFVTDINAISAAYVTAKGAGYSSNVTLTGGTNYEIEFTFSNGYVGEKITITWIGGNATSVENIYIGGHDILTIPTEELLVTAASTNSLESKVTSLSYPEDEIYYDIDGAANYDSGITQPADHKGWIYKRTTNYLEANYDYRACVLRCWHTDISAYTSNNDDFNVPVLWNTSVNVGTTSNISTSRITFNQNGNFTDRFTIKNSSTPIESNLISNKGRTAKLPVLSAKLQIQDFTQTNTFFAGDFTKWGDMCIYGGIASNNNGNAARNIHYPVTDGEGEFSANNFTNFIDGIVTVERFEFLGRRARNFIVMPKTAGTFINVSAFNCSGWHTIFRFQSMRDALEMNTVMYADISINQSFPTYRSIDMIKISGSGAKPTLGYLYDGSNSDDLTNYSQKSGRSNTIERTYAAATPTTTLDLTAITNFPFAGVLNIPNTTAFNTINRNNDFKHDFSVKAVGTATITKGTGNIKGSGNINLTAGQIATFREIEDNTYIVLYND